MRELPRLCLVNAYGRELETSELNLHPFEQTQIANLCPADAEEAQTLIPSLRAKPEGLDSAALDELLAQVRQHQIFS